MTLILARVASPAEAEIALRFGADIVDFKDPASDGAGDETVRTMAAGQRRTAATLGDAPLDAREFLARARALIDAGFDDLRIAVNAPILDALAGAFAPTSGEIVLVGIMYADRAPDFELLPALAAAGFKGATLDTCDKADGGLLTHLDVGRVEEFCERCRTLGLLSGLAGSLEAPDIPRLLLVAPDVLGFDVALRGQNGIDTAALRLIRDLIPRASAATGSPPGGASEGMSGEDNVFVRDFAIDAHVGAYVVERGASRRLIFNVDASVARAVAVDDLRSIFSYDIILDAIRLVVGRGHARFVETLAEGVAELVLSHERVRHVRVRVEKTGVIAGTVGVEIHRPRRGGAP